MKASFSSWWLPLILLLLPLFYLLRHRPKHRTAGPPAKARQYAKNGRSFLEWSADRLLAAPDATFSFFGGQIFTADPSVIDHVLRANFHNYPKGPALTSSFSDLLGDGIFNADGAHWQIQRKFAGLGFNARSLRSYLSGAFHPEISDRLLPLLSRAASSDRILDLQNVLDRFAFDSLFRVAFGFDPALLAADEIDPESDSARFARAFESALAIILNRCRPHLWRILRFLAIGDEAWLKEELITLENFVERLLKNLRKNRSDCLIAPFIDAHEFDDKFLRDIVINYVIAGRDTTSSALTWFFHLVSFRPDVRRRIRDEISAVRSKRPGSRERLYGAEELREMEYLHAAITETMRLYPPVPVNQRSCAEGDELPGGRKVKKGRHIFYNLYAMARMTRVWGEDCEKFRPERWLDERGAFRHESPFKFPIFYAGPRVCLGKEMAYMQMKAVAAAMIEKFDIERVGEEERGIEVAAVLRMKGGFPVKVREKRSETA